MIGSMGKHNESPVARQNPGGQKVWCARWTDKHGKVRYGNKMLGIPGTYRLKREAADAIRRCYEHDDAGPARSDTFGGYFATWTNMHPRAAITDATNESRIRGVIDVDVEGTPLRDWPLEMLRRRHANLLKEHLLVGCGRARLGVNGTLAACSAMFEDAIEDEVAVSNPFRGMKKVAANDPRIQKAPLPIRVFSWQQMHEFARVAGRVESTPEMTAWARVHGEPMVRALSDLGLRASEALALQKTDLDLKEATLRVERVVSMGRVVAGTKNDHGERDAGRTVPVPPELFGMLKRMMLAQPPHATGLLFPTPRGCLWSYTQFSRKVWGPAARLAGVDARPHEFRHSWTSLLRGAGVDPADLAKVAGHNVETQMKTYTHALNRSDDVIRRAVGE